MDIRLVFLSAFLITVMVSIIIFPRVIRRLKKSGMVGRDVNKPDQPEVAEMGGLVIAAAFSLGLLTMIGLRNFEELF